MIIADTGFWLALANCKDQYHQLATKKLNQLKEPFLTVDQRDFSIYRWKNEYPFNNILFS